MDVLYVCGSSLLDYSIEQIKDLTMNVDLHVVITVFLHSPNHTIFKIRERNNIEAGIYKFNEIKERIENPTLFKDYLNNCKSVHFVFFSRKFGLNIFLTNIELLRLVKKINPQIIHFDDISGRLVFFSLLLKNRKVVLNVHDPKHHSGEHKSITRIIRKFLFRRVSVFCTFSNYSKNLFEKIYSPTVPVIELRLVPYRSYLFFENEQVNGINKLPGEMVLLFFGRISQYKGIDELLITFSKLRKVYTKIKLVIAGEGSYKYNVPKDLIGSTSLVLINRFILQKEIKSIFEQADVLVCPYRDATQSGVLMTASIFGTPAIVSNVGALPEYIKEGENGYIYNIKDDFGLENAIIKFLLNKSISDNDKNFNNLDVSYNSKLLTDAYSKILKN